RSAACCGGEPHSVFQKVERAVISIVASAARSVVSGLLHRADGRRSRPRDLGERKDQGLSAVVLGRAAGAAGQGPLSQRSQRLFQLHLSAAVGGAARIAKLVRQGRSLYLPAAPDHRRLVDTGTFLERYAGVRQ